MKTILVADNDRDFVEARSEFLEMGGYRVLKAYAPEEAREILDRELIHLAILDIRLTDDTDETDTSGLRLAQELAYRSLPKIMLTGFPSVDAIKAVLKHPPDEPPPAVDFVSKHDGPEAMLEAVDAVFKEHILVNWDLQIYPDPQQHLSFLQLAGILQPNAPDGTLVHRPVELKDLFRRLLHGYHHVRLDRLFWQESGRFCLSLLTQSPQRATGGRLLVCSTLELFRRELERVREMAPATVTGLQLAGHAETTRFGAVAYALPDTDMETVQSLRGVFQAGNERCLRSPLERLLTESLYLWHQQGHQSKNEDLMALYRRQVGLAEGAVPRSEVARRMNAVLQASRLLGATEIESREGDVIFRFPHEPPLICPDPVILAHQPLKGFEREVVCRISPGRITADNILVDGNQQLWLTDFVDAGQVPQLWDFVCLEAAIRFDLSQAPDLLAWKEFEECLDMPSHLHEDLHEREAPAPLRTSVALIETVRRQAGREAGPELLPYYAGLLVWAVGALGRYDPAVLHTQAERLRSAHLLLGAAMIGQRLRQLLDPQPSTVRQSQGERLVFDNNSGQVRIGAGAVIDLMGLELELLRCLYEHAGEVVPRRVLFSRLYEEPYREGNKYQEGKLNTLVGRLRSKIEPNVGKPRYITTVKGLGYRLEMKHKDSDQIDVR